MDLNTQALLEECSRTMSLDIYVVYDSTLQSAHLLHHSEANNGKQA